MPQSSVAVQVRVITFSCGQLPAAMLSLKPRSRSLSQLSVALAVAVVAGSVSSPCAARSAKQVAAWMSAMHSIERSLGQVIAGALLSVIVIA